jgi:hypothetical protein
LKMREEWSNDLRRPLKMREEWRLLLPRFCFVLFVWFSWTCSRHNMHEIFTTGRQAKNVKVITLFIYLFISTAKYINIPMNWVCWEHGLENHKTPLICSLRQFIW